ncbi:MAG TPA: efflux RND transporter periplasmic adaptor subunit [Elusimicrobiota bacterium]|jgi:multidrug efflux pump subunit AcrA (membrane-fusion protein)|nr:efflux RND transporter periplasmic adaptor subunit [Elusimicrobiota bacterium]
MALKKRTIRGAAVLSAAAALMGGWAWRRHARSAESPDDKHAVAKRGPLEATFKEIGEVAAHSTVHVASKVSGRVIELAVQEGSRVAVGQKLAVIQPGRTEAEKFLPSTVSASVPGVVMRYIGKDTAGQQQADARFTEVGDYVTGLFESQNPTYLMTIADMRRLVVKLRISEMDVLKLREGMPVSVAVDALPEETFPGEVSMISPQAEKEQTGGKIFRVEVAFLKADPRLRTGMTARVTATLQRKENAVTVPLAGVFQEGAGSVAYLEREGEKPRQVRVKVGLRTELDAEVLDGLSAGDRVLTEKPADFTPLPGADEPGALAQAGAPKR